MERNRRPPGVEEALSSMLWTPYNRTPSISSEDDELPAAPSSSASKLKNSTKSKNVTLNVPPYSFLATQRHLYTEPIRYNLLPPYTGFVPKTQYNTNNQNAKLPSYENIQKQSHNQNFKKIATTQGIYLLPHYPNRSNTTSTMVNSFTDDFLNYQADNTITLFDTSSTTTKTVTATTMESASTSKNRFSNDFTTLEMMMSSYGGGGGAGGGNARSLMTMTSEEENLRIIQQQKEQKQQQTKITENSRYLSSANNIEDLHNYLKQSCSKQKHQSASFAGTLLESNDSCMNNNNVYVNDDDAFDDDDDYDDDDHNDHDLSDANNNKGNDHIYDHTKAIEKRTLRTTTQNTEIILDLPDDEFRVSKPPSNQSKQLQRSHDRVENDGGSQTKNKFYTENSHTQLVEANATNLFCKLFDDGPLINLSESSKCVWKEGAMRLNVTAPTQNDDRHHTMYVTGTAASSSASTSVVNVAEKGSKVLENGTLMGAIVSQPSSTVHLNQHDVVNQSSGVSIVNCYRAVPVHVVDNNVNNNNSASSVQINVNTSVNSNSSNCDNVNVNKNVDIVHVLSEVRKNDKCVTKPLDHNRNTHLNMERTYTSTEAQTDDLQNSATFQSISVTQPTTVLTQSPNSANQNQAYMLLTREQRRRDRRERRQARNARQQHVHPPASAVPATFRCSSFEILPDILNSHVPPPYTALTSATAASNTTSYPPPTLPIASPASVIVPSIITPLPITGGVAPDDGRYSFPIPIIRRSPSERSGKGCCGQWFAGPPLRAVIFVVALGGLACALGGAALGATGLAGPPTSHFTAALLMTGVGMILVTISGAAWRMTAPGTPQCLGFGSSGDLVGRCGRRPCSGRAPHGLLYPEFQHRPPPPSYQASMQEYRLRLLLLDRDRQSGVVRGASPPPTYRSNAGSLLRVPLSARCNNTINGSGSEYSLPPSYLAQNLNVSRQPATISTSSTTTVNGASGNTNSRIASLNNSFEQESPGLLSESTIVSTVQLHQQQKLQQPPQNSIISNASLDTSTTTSTTVLNKHHHNVLVEGVNNTKFSRICNNNISENSTTTNEQQNDNEQTKLCRKSAEINLGSSTNPIVACFNNEDDVCARKDLVTIVTISGCTESETSTGEMDILAHL